MPAFMLEWWFLGLMALLLVGLLVLALALFLFAVIRVSSQSDDRRFPPDETEGR